MAEKHPLEVRETDPPSDMFSDSVVNRGNHFHCPITPACKREIAFVFREAGRVEEEVSKLEATARHLAADAEEASLDVTEAIQRFWDERASYYRKERKFYNVVRLQDGISHLPLEIIGMIIAAVLAGIILLLLTHT